MHMNAGDEKSSYAKNSGFQKAVISKTLPVLNEILKDMFGDDTRLSLNTNSFKIVDLGCSSGPNTLWVMSHIVDKMEEFCNKKVLEFDVFLNDLPGNDFNNLFKLLPTLNWTNDGTKEQHRFWYGVPGSFYGRLFARNTLHFAYSSYSLHWLSKVPEEVESNNKENICLAMESSSKVCEAYAKQFRKDFSTFLRLRSEEIREGGSMVLIFAGRSVEDHSTYDDCAQFTLLSKSLMDMVTEGIVRQEDLYAFNIPFYCPCKQEVESIIENEASFTLHNILDFSIPWDVENNAVTDDDEQGNPSVVDKHKSGKIVADCHRALLEPMLSTQFASSIMDDLFQRHLVLAHKTWKFDKILYKMVAKNIMHMNAGDGKTSYVKNSGFQRAVISKTLPVLNEIFEDMFTRFSLNTNSFKIVDLGCSSGPNTLWVMSHIVDKIEVYCNKKVLEFDVFLNDLPGNDFNNLFKLLPTLNWTNDGTKEQHRFWYGVPGSFYGRLFARNTLHFAYSSYSLHWLSKVPEEVESNNKDNMCLAMESSSKVYEAYAKQFHKDFSTFLRLRSEEIMEGGRMVLILAGRSVEDHSTYDDCAQFTLLSKSLKDMVIEGIVRQEDLYTFNLPLYCPCKQEVEAIVENEASFTLHNILDFSIPWDVENDTVTIDDEQGNPLVSDKHKSGKIVANCHRALLEPMLSTHFASSIMDDLFRRYAEKVSDHLSTEKSAHFTLVISLTR